MDSGTGSLFLASMAAALCNPSQALFYCTMSRSTPASGQAWTFYPCVHKLGSASFWRVRYAERCGVQVVRPPPTWSLIRCCRTVAFHAWHPPTLARRQDE